MAQLKHILIICGEPSGDLLAGNLAREIKKLAPDLKISAVGGPTLEQNQAEVFYNIKGLAIMGFFDVLKNIPKFLKLKQIILEKIARDKPDAIIFVDFSGFNLRLAKIINKKIPAIYYVSPQIWASRAKRIEIIGKFISKIIVLFKFEEKLYKDAGMDVYFAGHPLLDTAKPALAKEAFLKQLRLEPQKTTISLLPGSRKQEIKNILPIMLKSAEIITKQINDAQFIIAKSDQIDGRIYEEIVRKSGIDVKISEGNTCSCLNAAELSLVCSGTATLEAAIINKPFLIVYKMSWLNYLLYRPQVKIPYIGMVNLVADKLIIPEFIQFKATPQRIAFAAINLLKDPGLREQMKSGLSLMRLSLGGPGASLRAAAAILEFLKSA